MFKYQYETHYKKVTYNLENHICCRLSPLLPVALSIMTHKEKDDGPKVDFSRTLKTILLE